MTKSEFEKLGYEWEYLPSGYINIFNSQPFRYNGTETICQTKGKYCRTTSVKSLDELFKKLIELATLNGTPAVKENPKKIAMAPKSAIEPVTNQDLGAFLTGNSTPDIKPKKRGRPKKS
jgi:hypothetical protein